MGASAKGREGAKNTFNISNTEKLKFSIRRHFHFADGRCAWHAENVKGNFHTASARSNIGIHHYYGKDFQRKTNFIAGV